MHFFCRTAAFRLPAMALLVAWSCGPQAKKAPTATGLAAEIDLGAGLDQLISAFDVANLAPPEQAAARQRISSLGKMSVADFFSKATAKMPDSTLRLNDHLLTNARIKMLAHKASFVKLGATNQSIAAVFGGAVVPNRPLDRTDLKRRIAAALDAFQGAASAGLWDEPGQCQKVWERFNSCTPAHVEGNDAKAVFLNSLIAFSDGESAIAGPLALAMCQAIAAAGSNCGPEDQADAYCPDSAYQEHGGASSFVFQSAGNTYQCGRQGPNGTRVLTNLQPSIDQFCPDSEYEKHGGIFNFETAGHTYQCSRVGDKGVRTLNMVQ